MNRYLEKIAESFDDLKEDIKKPWTVWGQKEVMNRHGYDVNKTQLSQLNVDAFNHEPIEQIKKRWKHIGIGAGIGGITGGGALALSNLHYGTGKAALYGAAMGALTGAGVGSLTGAVAVGKDISNKYFPKLLKQRIESGEFKRFNQD
jgi:hypothetical protein